MIVELSKAKVEIKDSLTWGDSEKIQSAIMKGANLNGKANQTDNTDFSFDASALLESKYIALECAVISIEEDGEKKQWTREWQDNLSMVDGNKLYEAVDGLSKN